MIGESSGYYLRLVVLFVVYLVTARVGLSLDAVSGFAALVWPPTGIALAALLIMGYRYWPAIFVAALTVNMITGASLPVATGIGVGNTLEALAGAYVLKRFTLFQPSLERVSDVLRLIFLAAILCTLISACIGVTSLYLGGVVENSALLETWSAWWVGDMLGVLVVTPLLLVWSVRLRRPIVFNRFRKVITPVLLLIAASVLAFRWMIWFDIPPFAFAYLVFPFLIWIALKFGQLGGVTAMFIVACVAIWGTVATHHDTQGSLSQSLFLLQSFIGVSAATFMTFAALVSEREHTLRHQQVLQQKAASLTKQRAHLKSLNQAKDEFISIASHQLRTPATVVKQYLAMLLENYAGKLPKKQVEYIELAYESNERQLRVINDLLNVAKVDANKLQLAKKPSNIVALVADVVAEQVKLFEKRKQTLVFNPTRKTLKALVDKELLCTAFENIIDNAGKYSPPGEKVQIEVMQVKNTIQILIHDQGLGISRQDQRKLFKKFSRINDAHSSSVDGSGLGLYWAKKVIDLHGGTIGLESSPGEGSTFIISLPIK